MKIREISRKGAKVGKAREDFLASFAKAWRCLLEIRGPGGGAIWDLHP
jgi:hypothetical protein